jgi:hypothetical protein
VQKDGYYAIGSSTRFFKQVQKTRTLPFIISAHDETNANPEECYAEWLNVRLKNTIEKLGSG